MENKDKIKWSHSTLGEILSQPASYYLSHIQKIDVVQSQPALETGSLYHWCVEHGVDICDGYYEEQGKKVTNYTDEMCLAECMASSYLRKKEELLDKILTMKDGSKRSIQEEIHELKLEAKMKSSKNSEDNEFLGIIDLLFLTDKNTFIICDHKTYSREPDFSTYEDQLFRYVILAKRMFPETPVEKIAIIGNRKIQLRRKKNENDESFKNRMKIEYANEDTISYHEFDPEDLDKDRMARYEKNLERTIDLAETIVADKNWFINYANVRTQYGLNKYAPIFYHQPDCCQLYSIKDSIVDEWDENKILESRPCKPLDMEVLEKSNVLNHYKQYKDLYKKAESNPLFKKDEFIKNIKKEYITDDGLLDEYSKVVDLEKKKGIF